VSRSSRSTVVIALTALAAAAAAAAFLTYALRPRPRAPDPDDDIAIGPDWNKPAHPWTPELSARVSKRDGLLACSQKNWRECYRQLREAQADDPTLEKDPAVVNAMQDAVEAMRDESNRYAREHSGM
jgi:hypothetical protein